MNPFDLRGPEFLVFYFIFSVVVIVAFVLMRRASESATTPKVDLSDPYLIAYLRGGKNEALRVAVVSLIDRGLLVYDGTKIGRASNASSASVRRPLEKALMDKFSWPAEAKSIFDDSTLESVCDPYEETLSRDRLLPDEKAKQVRLALSVAVFFLLATVGGIKVSLALERGRTNVGFLIILMVIAIAVAVKTISPRLTSTGSAMLADVQTLYAGLKGRATQIRPGGATLEPLMLAAAFGVGALPGDGFAYTKTLFPRAQSSTGSSCGSSSGSSCGSSCGGGGCGGGCGGCGG